MGKKNLRRISILVTAQTAYNLRRLADMAQVKEPGMIVDKLVRDRLKLIRPERAEEELCSSCTFIVRCSNDPSFQPPFFARCREEKEKTNHRQKEGK